MIIQAEIRIFNAKAYGRIISCRVTHHASPKMMSYQLGPIIVIDNYNSIDKKINLRSVSLYIFRKHKILFS